MPASASTLCSFSLANGAVNNLATCGFLAGERGADSALAGVRRVLTDADGLKGVLRPLREFLVTAITYS